MRCTQDAVLLEQVLNDRLLLPVDPAGEDENDEGKRRRQRVHGASVPDRLIEAFTDHLPDRSAKIRYCARSLAVLQDQERYFTSFARLFSRPSTFSFAH